MFNFLKKKKKIVTHDGKFHTDDIFACAILTLVCDAKKEGYSVTRSRDMKVIEGADYVIDVGGIHNPETNRFDHHQPGGAGVRANGIPFAAAGLTWATYGVYLSGSIEARDILDGTIFQPIDADDNGVSLVELKYDVRPYRIQEALYEFRPTWNEEQNFDTTFFKLVFLARDILSRAIIQTQAALIAKEAVEKAYTLAQDKRVIELEKNYPFTKTLLAYPEPLYVVYQRPIGGWKIEAVAKGANTFDLRKPLPEKWAGLKDEKLKEVTGVADAIFCHNGRFMAVAQTKEGVRKLAELAIKG